MKVVLPSGWYDARTSEPSVIDEKLELGFKVIRCADAPDWRHARELNLTVAFGTRSDDCSVVLKDERDLQKFVDWVDREYDDLLNSNLIRRLLG